MEVKMQNDVVELKFKGERRAVFTNPQQLQFKVGDYAVVQADNGLDMGRINHISGLMIEVEDDKKLKKIITEN